MESREKAEQNSGKSETKDLSEAQENVRKSRDEDATEEPVDPKKTGNLRGSESRRDLSSE